MYATGLITRYVAAFTLGDWVFVALQECVPTSSGACGRTVARLARFCRATPSSSSQPSAVAFNGFRKLNVSMLHCTQAHGKRIIVMLVTSMSVGPFEGRSCASRGKRVSFHAQRCVADTHHGCIVVQRGECFGYQILRCLGPQCAVDTTHSLHQMGCGGRNTVVAAHLVSNPPPSLTATLGAGAILLVVGCDTDTTTGVQSNFALCVHKVHTPSYNLSLRVCVLLFSSWCRN